MQRLEGVGDEAARVARVVAMFESLAPADLARELSAAAGGAPPAAIVHACNRRKATRAGRRGCG